MPYAKLPKDFPEPTKLPKRYSQDARWINENINALTQKYPDHWVAVLEKEVTVASEDLGEVDMVAHQREAEVSKGQCVYTFIEGLWQSRGKVKVQRPS